MAGLLVFTHAWRRTSGLRVDWDDVNLDPGLVRHRRKLVTEAARHCRAKMVRFDEKSGFIYQTEAGRIASHFYIKQASMELFGEHLPAHVHARGVSHGGSGDGVREHRAQGGRDAGARGTQAEQEGGVPAGDQGTLADSGAR